MFEASKYDKALKISDAYLGTDFVNSHRYMPMHKFRKVDAVKIMVNAFPDIDIYGMACLLAAQIYSDSEVQKRILTLGKDKNIPSSFIQSCLDLSNQKVGFYDVVKMTEK